MRIACAWLLALLAALPLAAPPARAAATVASMSAGCTA